jgi:hypothetical protein
MTPRIGGVRVQLCDPAIHDVEGQIGL